MRRQLLKIFLWGVLLAAMVAAGIIIFHRTPEQRLSNIEKQINAHYRQYRTFPYRWPGVLYAPIRGLTGGQEAKDARRSIGRILADLDLAERLSGQSVRSLQLRGRTELLAEDYDRAVQHYHQAILQSPIDPELQLELGIAFAVQARKDDRALDYEHSLEAMVKAGRQGGPPETLFDLALVLTEFPLPNKAIESWRHVVSSETSQEWRREAQEQLATLEQAQKSRAQRIHDLTASAESYLTHATKADAALELVVDAAIEDWLPEAGESGQKREALEHLAEALKTAHQEQWLSDMLKAPASPDNSLALKFLADSRKASLQGKLDATQAAAKKAEALFSRVGNLAGTLRSRVEGIHSLARHWKPQSCIKALAGLRSAAARKHYAWVEGQAWLEEVTCKTESRQAEVISEREKAYEWIKTTGYEALSLRALSFMTEDYVSIDSRLTTWKRGHEGLKAFWNTPMRPERGYLFYFNLGRSAQSAGDFQATVSLVEEGLHLLEQSGNLQLIAQVLSYLGDWQWQGGHYEDANHTFDRMESLFKQLDQKEALESYRESETIRARTEVERGESRRALSRLDALTNDMRFPYPPIGKMLRRRLFPAYGDAYLQQGRLDLAAKHYNQIIHEIRKDLEIIKSPPQRDNAMHEIEPAWKGLTEVELRGNQVAQAWETWEEFRGGRFQRTHHASTRPPQEMSLLVYAFLPSGLSAWLVQADSIEHQWIDPEKARNQAERLALLAADRDSQLSLVKTSARELHAMLIQPFAASLASTRTLVVDADGPLAGIPWAALEDGHGRALIEQFAIAQVAGWDEVSGHLHDKPVNLHGPLVFGGPALGPELTKEFPRLPEIEQIAKNLNASLPGATFFEDEDATADILLNQLPRSTFFYFAGHGVSYGGFGALLLAPQPPERAQASFVTAAKLAGLELRRLDLVVLASCSSGVGEQYGVVNLDGLVRGFLEAGTTRVVAARWNVNSTETAEIIRKFHDLLPGLSSAKALREAASPAEALRQAALEVRRNSPHPYFWAGLQVFGAP